MNRTFTYHEGAVTKAHETAGKQVSEPTTTLVKEIRFHDGRTIAYEYDEEERKAHEKITYSSQFNYCGNNVANQNDTAGMFPVVFAALSLAIGVGIETFALSIKLYELSLLNFRKNCTMKFCEWFGVGSYLKMRLKDSGVIKDYIKLTANKIYLRAGSEVYNKNIDFYNYKNPADLDLKYAIGGTTSFKLKVTKTTKKYFWDSRRKKHIIEISMTDRYDFHCLTKNDNGRLTRIINNWFGYYPQTWGVLSPYWWTFSCSFNCYL